MSNPINAAGLRPALEFLREVERLCPSTPGRPHMLRLYSDNTDAGVLCIELYYDDRGENTREEIVILESELEQPVAELAAEVVELVFACDPRDHIGDDERDEANAQRVRYEVEGVV